MFLSVLTLVLGCAPEAGAPALPSAGATSAVERFVPSFDLEFHVTSDTLELLATGAPPNTVVYFAGSGKGPGAGPCPGKLGGQCVDLALPVTLAGKATSDADGNALLTTAKPPGGWAFQALIPAGAASQGSNTITYTPLACDIFPADNAWNTDISAYPVHANSTAFIDAIGRFTGLHPDFGTRYAGAPNGIPYVEVDAAQALVNIAFGYAQESDPGPYPIPPNAPIEGGPQGNGDRHVLVVERTSCALYETWESFPQAGGDWLAGSGATWDLGSNALRPDYWTSADAAGLPIYPGLVKYDEVVGAGVIDHALRFTVSASQKGFIHPATHYASSCSVAACPNDPPMGLRVRMKANYNCGGLSNEVQVICAALKKYGMFVADNGSDWYVSGAPDARWNDNHLADLSAIPGDAFEVVDTGPVIQ